MQQLALCSETLAHTSLVLHALHQFGVSVVLRLDGALRIALTRCAVLKATFELRKLARHTLPVGHESSVRTLQRLESRGALLEKRSGGCKCRALSRFSGMRGGQFLSESGGLALRFIQLGEAPLRGLSLTGQLILKDSRTVVQCLEIRAGRAELATECIGARYTGGPLVLCDTQRGLLSAQLLGLLYDPALDLQHDIRVAHSGCGVGFAIVGRLSCRAVTPPGGDPAGGWFSRFARSEFCFVRCDIECGKFVGRLELGR
ncbi:MAG TPA: hypothetical protein VNY25_02565 [Steroidobacteraceae bacterium]|nr:hypothetical protein [Steroidobacteraceae bacterium]